MANYSNDFLQMILGKMLSGGSRRKETLSLSGIQKRLDYYAGTVDLNDPKAVEGIITKIETARTSGQFGNDPAINEFVTNYMGVLAQGSFKKDQILTDRKDLYSLTNPSSINKLLSTSITSTDPDYNPVEAIENQIVDLSMARDRLADSDGLSTALDTRYNNAIAMFDNSLKEHGTDGLTEEEMARIMNDTYATQKLADVNFGNLKRQYDFAREFEKPSLKEKQLIALLEEHQSSIKKWDDEAALMDYEYQWLQVTDPLMMGEEVPDLKKAEQGLYDREAYRQSLLLPSHAQQYRAVYDTYQELRKNNPKAMQYNNWDDIMDTTVHNELYNFVSITDPNNPAFNTRKNTTFKPGRHGSKGENEIVYSMLERGNINFTNDIAFDDPSFGIWKNEGEALQGLGKPGNDTWKIKSVDRDDNGSLKRIVLTVPNYDKTKTMMSSPSGGGLGLAGTQTMRAPTEKTIILNAEDFVIEDDPNNPHKGFHNTVFGAARYNLFTGRFEY